MKKVIAVRKNEYVITTQATAEKKRLYIAYSCVVTPVEEERPDWRDKDKLPYVGMIMRGMGGHYYKLREFTPTYVCADCDRKNSKNRIGNYWYCTPHFKKLTITKPIVGTGNIPGRNQPCHCGSGKKYKHCCLPKDRHDPRHYFNSDYKRHENQNKKTA